MPPTNEPKQVIWMVNGLEIPPVSEPEIPWYIYKHGNCGGLKGTGCFSGMDAWLTLRSVETLENE